MRTRQKVTAVGAVALASAAIGSGALFTSNAMAADPAPPATGTLVIISRSAGSDQAIKCTYHDVDLPPLRPGTAHVIHGSAEAPEGGSVEITGGPAGVGPVGDGPGTKAAGAVFTQGAPDADAGGGDVASFSVEGPPPVDAGKGPVVLDDLDARQGTDAECAALRPDVQAQP
jgi:hypothetical protein